MDYLDQIEEAKWLLVHDHNGGAVALAQRLSSLQNRNVSSAVVSNKVNKKSETHHLTLDEAVLWQSLRKDYRLLQSMNAALGFIAFPAPTSQLLDTCDTELLLVWAEWQMEIAQAVQAMHETLADGKIEAHEVRKIAKELHESFAKGLQLLQRFEALQEQD